MIVDIGVLRSRFLATALKAKSLVVLKPISFPDISSMISKQCVLFSFMRRAAERIDVCGSQCTGISAILDRVFFVLIAEGEGDGDGEGEVAMEFMLELGFVLLLLCFLLKKSMYLCGEGGGPVLASILCAEGLGLGSAVFQSSVVSRCTA